MKQSIVRKLQKAADELEAQNDEYVLFPGIEDAIENSTPRLFGAIMAAHKLTLVQTLDGDDGVQINTKKLVYLIRYIADMMEE